MSKAFYTINIHTLIRKLLQTKIPGTIIKFIAEYIKGCKAYTTYRSHILTSIQNWHSTRWRPLTNTIQHLHYRYTTTQRTGSGHDITITFTHTSTSAAKNTYNHTHIKFLPGQNKTTCTLLTTIKTIRA